MISPKSLMKIATTASVVAMTVSVAVVPAYAMQDIAIEDTPSSFAATVDDAQNSSNSMPDNPNATLPETVSENISDDSTVVSENLAVTPEGDVQNIETGETVTDAQLVGTQSQQPDPLAKTDGESFIPVSALDVKDAVEQSVKQSVEQSSSKNGATVKLAKFDGNDYGAHWGTYNNTKAFFDYRNNLFVQQAKGVIDVSSWQGDIDWAKAKADGVEGSSVLALDGAMTPMPKRNATLTNASGWAFRSASTGTRMRRMRAVPGRRATMWCPSSARWA